jgi:hypothetical protein
MNRTSHHGAVRAKPGETIRDRRRGRNLDKKLSLLLGLRSVVIGSLFAAIENIIDDALAKTCSAWRCR